MIPVTCRIPHSPKDGKYGDCLRACVASILELDAEAVPHFFHDNCSAYEGNRRLAEFLASVKVAPFQVIFDGDQSLQELLDMMGHQNGEAHYILFGSTENGDHAVVCKGGNIVHNPGWGRPAIVGCNSAGVWGVMVLCK